MPPLPPRKIPAQSHFSDYEGLHIVTDFDIRFNADLFTPGARHSKSEVGWAVM